MLQINMNLGMPSTWHMARGLMAHVVILHIEWEELHGSYPHMQN